MSHSAAVRTIHDDYEIIERYVSATFARYEREIVERMPMLDEPRIAALDLADKRLRFFVETLGGYAVGAAVGAVARVLRQGFGEDVRTRVRALIDQIVAGGGAPVAVVTELVPPAPFVRIPGRPLLEAAGSRLHARLCRAIPETRKHLSDLHAEVVRAAPDLLPAFSNRLVALVDDDAPALAFADQLAAGWRHYATAVSAHRGAHIAGAPPPGAPPPGPWLAWTQRLTGRAAPKPPTRDEVVAQGFLLQIA